VCAQQVGTATLEELHRQRAQINDITEEVLLIDDNLTRAEKVRDCWIMNAGNSG
jgi:hypothetical protein